MRNVYFGDAAMGRVSRYEHGPKEGLWKWNGRWGGLIDGQPVTNSGICDTMDEALECLRETAIDLANRHPHVILWTFEHDPYARGQKQAYLAELLDEKSEN
ncbi:hypothetical protein [Maritalea myrionectae]|uniref:hypothetical protein n=1 Tax=Maritalea myrionectae TaxID=454601 RepID=UPI0013C35DB7|nr:hypothetical protein [Maritalea myrionectae]